MRIPTGDEIRVLHQKYAATPAVYERVYTHCRIVADLADQLIDRGHLDVDRELVRAGALLHDIGVYRLDGSAYIRHGVLGHELLSELGYPEELARFCSRHTGVGLTRADVVRQQLPLPVADYVPESMEEELVLYADKFHSKTEPPVFLTAAVYAAQVARFGAGKVALLADLRARYGEPALAELAGSYGHEILTG